MIVSRTKIVGLMCVRDEADLLPQTYPHIRSLVDYLYVYEDGSQDDTWSFVKDSDYAIRRVDDKERLDIPRPNYHHLLERIKIDFKGEDNVWAVISMGDRFFLNKTPKEIVESAEDFEAVDGAQLDFLRHRFDPWTEENDPWPDMADIRTICRWFKFDERCVVAYKVTDSVSYLEAKYPWPRGIKSLQYNYKALDGKICLDMPFLEHQGRRTPKASIWRYTSGSRPVGRKHQHLKFGSVEEVIETQRKFYSAYKILPWADTRSLDKMIELHNEDNWKNSVQLRYFFWGLEHAMKCGWYCERADI